MRTVSNWTSHLDYRMLTPSLTTRLTVHSPTGDLRVIPSPANTIYSLLQILRRWHVKTREETVLYELLEFHLGDVLSSSNTSLYLITFAARAASLAGGAFAPIYGDIRKISRIVSENELESLYIVI